MVFAAIQHNSQLRRNRLLGRACRASGAAAPRRKPLLAGAVVICVTLFALESLYRWPNYLAYFNLLAGGPAHGYQHLADSSLDWGQDLPALRELARE